ncbi:hypothetical protein ACEZCY_25940 [Streptacidiphilus sp. N1-12]|uniref:Uncharacterized protein n=2 Tax=Streptacidiphilus alkalitolerans TaxID=3342712 RepID=A0ABV6WKS6_9ACTN
MAGGGEEKAVFHALRTDAEKSLPKIAEKHAGVVDSAVEKGTKNLAEHAANEKDIAEGFRSAMPKDDPVTAPKPSAGVPGEAAVPGASPSRITQALDAGPSPATLDAAAPQLGRDALHDGEDFNTQIDQELNARGLDRAEHDRLRTSPTNDLTDEQIQQVVDVRNSIKIADGQVVTKVLGPDVAKSYLENADHLPNGKKFDPSLFGGSIARGTDTAALTTPSELRDALALDDKGAGWTPIPEGASHAYQLRTHAPDNLPASTTFGAVDDPAVAQHVADLAGASGGRAWQDPFTGTGYTGGGIPEWDANPTAFLGRAEIWRMTPDGGESLAGYFDGTRWTKTDG